MYKTSIKLLFCKDTYILAEIQRVGNPERPSKLQNSSAKVSRNFRKIFVEEKNKTCLGFGVSSKTEGDFVFIPRISRRFFAENLRKMSNRTKMLARGCQKPLVLLS